MENWNQWLPLLLPIVFLQLGLMIFALVDLVRREKTKGPKWAWALIIVIISFIGPIAYLMIGREE